MRFLQLIVDIKNLHQSSCSRKDCEVEWQGIFLGGWNNHKKLLGNSINFMKIQQ